MTLKISSVLSEALEQWKADSSLLWPVAGIFIFLPRWIYNLVVMAPYADQKLPKANPFDPNDPLMQTMLTWAPLLWLITGFGSALMLMLFLDPERPPLRVALTRIFPRIWIYLLVIFAVDVVTFAGFVLFIIPGLYLFGRLWLCGASVMARPGLKMSGAVSEAIALTENRVLYVIAIAAVPIVASIASIPITQTITLIAEAVAGKGLLAMSIWGGASAFVSSATEIASILLQVVVYRALTSPRQGI